MCIYIGDRKEKEEMREREGGIKKDKAVYLLVNCSARMR